MLAIEFAMLSSHCIEIIARGGGGGSGGGGGGGGIFAWYYLIAYLPMHWLGRKFRRSSPDGKASGLHQAIGVGISLFYGLVATFVVMYLSATLAIIILPISVFGMAAGLYNIFDKIKPSKIMKRQIKEAESKDPIWDEATLTEYAKNMFLQFQQDWSQNNLTNLKSYLTPSYYEHVSMLLAAMNLLGRFNQMDDVVIDEAEITDVLDALDNSNDRFTIGFAANARDSLIEIGTEEVIFTDQNDFTEFWSLKRSGNNWLLDGIRQATEDKTNLSQSLLDFATQHGCHYSLDMGWLLLPRHGKLFSDSKFGKSDVNNHIIGLHGNLLFQLYTYFPDPRNKPNKSFVVAQVQVPKSYGHIAVLRKKLFSALFGAVDGLNRVSTEWKQFNDKYDVYATSIEQATSLELLNPLYMEKLEAAGFEVNIEVVDNIIYLYAPEAEQSVEVYSQMLDLIADAYKELRL